MYNTVTVKLEPVIKGWRKGFLGKLACLIGWHKGSIHDEKGWIECDRCKKKYLNLYKKYNMK